MGQRQAIAPGTDIQSLVDGYFAECEASKQTRELKNGDVKIRQTIPSMEGLALYLRVNPDTLYQYMNGDYSHSDDIAMKEYTQLISDVLSRARTRMIVATLEAASNGDMDSKVASLRLGKYGYSTKIEQENKGSVTVKWEGVTGSDADVWGS